MENLIKYYQTPLKELTAKLLLVSEREYDQMTEWQKQNYDLVMKHKNKEQDNGN